MFEEKIFIRSNLFHSNSHLCSLANDIWVLPWFPKPNVLLIGIVLFSTTTPCGRFHSPSAYIWNEKQFYIKGDLWKEISVVQMVVRGIAITSGKTNLMTVNFLWKPHSIFISFPPSIAIRKDNKYTPHHTFWHFHFNFHFSSTLFPFALFVQEEQRRNVGRVLLMLHQYFMFFLKKITKLLINVMMI